MNFGINQNRFCWQYNKSHRILENGSFYLRQSLDLWPLHPTHSTMNLTFCELHLFLLTFLVYLIFGLFVFMYQDKILEKRSIPSLRSESNTTLGPAPDNNQTSCTSSSPNSIDSSDVYESARSAKSGLSFVSEVSHSTPSDVANSAVSGNVSAPQEILLRLRKWHGHGRIIPCGAPSDESNSY